MDLSVIIVNYNVKYFLEHCLASVEKAIQNITAEVIIVDNNSTDGTSLYFKNRFSAFQFIFNEENHGFAKGNNIALHKATGKYILFLNPDTIVPEDCFEKCINFMKQKKDCAAIGVKMVDGTGSFLKESKRSFPSPLTSFFKLSGLASLFPKSSIFGRYHLGNLSENETHEVDVLAGAFMMIKKFILDSVGSFDESFFMYGEDVDLSYRIQKAGYKNYYFADTTIIHFKGESTKRGTLNYVKMFYKAMSQFVAKHYGQTKAGTFNIFIQMAIFMRASLSTIKRAIQFIGLPLIDAVIIILSIWATKLFWFAKIKPDIKYNREIIVSAAIVYTLVYLLISYLTGLYDKPYKQKNLNRSALTSALILIALYGLLPENLRFSRGIIVLSATVIFLSITFFRYILVKTEILDAITDEDEEKQTVVIADTLNYNLIKQIYTKANMPERLLGYVNTKNDSTGLANYSDLKEFKKTISFKNIVFSCNSISYKHIIEQMHFFKNYTIKFYEKNTFSIIGSDSKNTIGESITQHGKFNIELSSAIRAKRMVDIGFSILLILLSPFIIWFSKSKTNYFGELFSILFGNRTFIGYNKHLHDLPQLKKSILTSTGKRSDEQQQLSDQVLYEIDYRYAKSYRSRNDIKIILKNYF